MQEHLFTAPPLVAEGVVRGLKMDMLQRDLSHVLTGLQTMDAGCGTGTVGNELAKMGAEDIDGLDISGGMLNVARKSGVYKELKVADLTKTLEIKNGKYDALVCCGTFTHGHLGPGPLAEFLRVVKTGGVVVATVLDSHWVQMGFEAEVERLVKERVCEVVESETHQYRKDAGGGRLLILRSL